MATTEISKDPVPTEYDLLAELEAIQRDFEAQYAQREAEVIWLVRNELIRLRGDAELHENFPDVYLTGT